MTSERRKQHNCRYELKKSNKTSLSQLAARITLHTFVASFRSRWLLIAPLKNARDKNGMRLPYLEVAGALGVKRTYIAFRPFLVSNSDGLQPTSGIQGSLSFRFRIRRQECPELKP